jgi:hypothetical protein
MAFRVSATSLNNYFSKIQQDEEYVHKLMDSINRTTQTLTDQEAICLAFEHTFRIGVKRPLFKVGY